PVPACRVLPFYCFVSFVLISKATRCAPVQPTLLRFVVVLGSSWREKSSRHHKLKRETILCRETSQLARRLVLGAAGISGGVRHSIERRAASSAYSAVPSFSRPWRSGMK
ncbi:unnamed protein product, partial [Hapterophycus canaliculatus]